MPSSSSLMQAAEMPGHLVEHKSLLFLPARMVFNLRSSLAVWHARVTDECARSRSPVRRLLVETAISHPAPRVHEPSKSFRATPPHRLGDLEESLINFWVRCPSASAPSTLNTDISRRTVSHRSAFLLEQWPWGS